jgi:hypothetical protein
LSRIPFFPSRVDGSGRYGPLTEMHRIGPLQDSPFLPVSSDREGESASQIPVDDFKIDIRPDLTENGG